MEKFIIIAPSLIIRFLTNSVLAIELKTRYIPEKLEFKGGINTSIGFLFWKMVNNQNLSIMKI